MMIFLWVAFAILAASKSWPSSVNVVSACGKHTLSMILYRLHGLRLQLLIACLTNTSLKHWLLKTSKDGWMQASKQSEMLEDTTGLTWYDAND